MNTIAKTFRELKQYPSAFIGALIMFGLLGFIPGWVTAKILAAFDLLRIPKQVELAGLDISANVERIAAERGIINAERDAIGGAAGAD